MRDCTVPFRCVTLTAKFFAELSYKKATVFLRRNYISSMNAMAGMPSLEQRFTFLGKKFGVCAL